MCASYGLDPRFTDAELINQNAEAILDGLREWSTQNAGATLRPTGKIARNVNPLIVPGEHGPSLTSAWWGYLVDGAPAKWPSINTRSERLQDRPGGLRTRAIVPATQWFEMQKPSKVWHRFRLTSAAAFGMAAVTQKGRDADGDWHTCYSVVMRPARADLAPLHDRMPLLLPRDFADEWLSGEPTRELIDEAILASGDITERIVASFCEKRP